MAGDGGVTGIDPASWQVTILPLPKRFSRGSALGFCGGHPVGRAETARARSLGCWWPEGAPELLTLAGQKDVATGCAAGDVIPGHWRNATTAAMGAVAWRVHEGQLVATELHDGTYASTWATAAGGGAVVGSASPRATPGQRAHKIGLVWRAGAAPTAVAAAGDVSLFATDGTRLVGSVHGRATLWPTATAAPVDLAPEAMPMSEVQALDGELQIGIAWKGMCARAGFWRGTAASFSDLTPMDFEAGRAFGATRGFQVGFVRRKDTTRNGSTGSDNRAVLWQGAADRWLDLNALLQAKKYNASVAWAIEIRGDAVQVCGEASRYEVSNPGTAQESHFVPVAHPVLWTARLAAGS
jgi:hypothetical protein